MDLISKRTRNEFRETLVAFVLREIEMFFEGAGLSKNEDYVPPVDGARRSLVERYYVVIDFSSPADIKKLLSAYGEIVISLDRNGVNESTRDNLLRLMKRDGYDFDGDTFFRSPVSNSRSSTPYGHLRPPSTFQHYVTRSTASPAPPTKTRPWLSEQPRKWWRQYAKPYFKTGKCHTKAKISHSSSELRPRSSPSYPKAFLTMPRARTQSAECSTTSTKFHRALRSCVTSMGPAMAEMGGSLVYNQGTPSWL